MDKKRLGVMVDCSRNAVMTVDTLKKFIDSLSKMGYNMLMLYTEDTYEVDNQPWFGYLRGRYSKDELKEIVAYGEEKGIELIPCIQTLAHLNQLLRWYKYDEVRDCDDILLIDEPKTYELIEDMFKTVRECYKTDYIHIGMDEAHNVGLGKHLDRHGFCNRFELLGRHLNKVAKLAEKYGFKPIMWSDMFFRLANNGVYDTNDPEIITEDIKNQVPDNVELCYWDYCKRTREPYEIMIEAHKRFERPIWFAGGAWMWKGFSPDNEISITRTEAAVSACKNKSLTNVFITCWGDDGAESPYFSILPTLFYAAEAFRGNNDLKDIKSKFEAMFGIGFDDFCTVDLPSKLIDESHILARNPDKVMLYNDPFLGIYDKMLFEDDREIKHYKNVSRKLKPLCDNENFGYIFRSSKALCDLLAVKYTLGRDTRIAYFSNEKQAVLEIADRYKKAIRLLDAFIKEFKACWLKEKKPHGFDVQDIRLGGLRQRLVSCRERLLQYANGEIDRIEELEEPQHYVDGLWFTNWRHNASANNI